MTDTHLAESQLGSHTKEASSMIKAISKTETTRHYRGMGPMGVAEQHCRPEHQGVWTTSTQTHQ